MKKIGNRLYWADWEMIILSVLLGIVCLVFLAVIVVLILAVCGVIPMAEDGNSNTAWLSLITISNALRMMR